MLPLLALAAVDDLADPRRQWTPLCKRIEG